MKKIMVFVFALFFISPLVFAEYGDYSNSDSSSNSGTYQSTPVRSQYETTSETNARHESEEYQARQDNPTQIDPHRKSPLGDETTREDADRYGK
jgi:hypothetical protein